MCFRSLTNSILVKHREWNRIELEERKPKVSKSNIIKKIIFSGLAYIFSQI